MKWALIGHRRLFSVRNRPIASVDDLLVPLMQAMQTKDDDQGSFSTLDIERASSRHSCSGSPYNPQSDLSSLLAPTRKVIKHTGSLSLLKQKAKIFDDSEVSLLDSHQTPRRKSKRPKNLVDRSETKDLESEPIKSSVAFEAIEIIPRWLKDSLRSFGIQQATPIQTKLMDGIIRDRRSLILRAQTGTGKSFGYIIGLLAKLHLYRFSTPSGGSHKRLPGRASYSMWEPLYIVLVPNAILGRQLFSWVQTLVSPSFGAFGNKVVRVLFPSNLNSLRGIQSKITYETVQKPSPNVSNDESQIEAQFLPDHHHSNDAIRNSLDPESCGDHHLENMSSTTKAGLSEDTCPVDASFAEPGRSFMLICTPTELRNAQSAGRLSTRQIQLVILDEADHLVKPMSLYANHKKIKNRQRHPVVAMSLLKELRVAREAEGLKMPRLCLTSASLSRQCAVDLARQEILCFKDSVLVKEPLTCPTLIRHSHRLVEDAFEMVSVVAALAHEVPASDGVIFIDGSHSKTHFIGVLEQVGITNCTLMGYSHAGDSMDKSRLKREDNSRKFTAALQSSIDKESTRAEMIHAEENMQGFGSSPTAPTKELRSPKKGALYVGSIDDARGWDSPNLQYVIIIGCPRSPTDYLHVAGRVGRCGRPGRVITIVESPKELERLTSMHSMLGISNAGPLVFESSTWD